MLVVSHNSALLCALWSKDESRGWALEVVSTPWEAMDKIQSGSIYDLLLLDVSQENGDGMHILRWMRRLRPALPIVIVGHTSDETQSADWFSVGGCEFVNGPLDDQRLLEAIQRNFTKQSFKPEAEITSDDVEQIGGGRYYIGASAEMRKLREQSMLLAQTNAPVLILGETGSGKETLGRLVHKLSVRSAFDFAKVACAALPGDLLMKELFGCQSSNPNTAGKAGKLVLYARGTVLLREITEMPLSLQDSLLEVLKNRQYCIPGTSEWCTTEVRILATCSMDIGRAIAENRLRETLYAQLRNYTVHVPPLRERKEEIPILALHFMHRLSKHYGLPPREFSASILSAWQDHHWPGNLRELERCVKRYLMLGDQDLFLGVNRNDAEGLAEASDFKSANKETGVAASQRQAVNAGSKSLRSLVQTVKSEAERNAIAVALEKTGWNRKAAARLLKVSYRTVLYKIQQYQMSESERPLMARLDSQSDNEKQVRDEGIFS